MAKLYPVFNFFDSRPGDMRRILEKGNSVVLTGATVQATICVKVTEFAFLETGFVYLTFLHCRIKRPPIKHMSHVFCPRFTYVFMKCMTSTFESQIFMSYRREGAS